MNSIKNNNDSIIFTFDVTVLSNNPNESYTRFPDLYGNFTQHDSASTGILFSPGTKADGTKLTLDPAEYAKYEEEPGDKFDWKDFNSMLKNPQTIDRNMKMLKKAMANAQNKVTILTARAQGYPMKHFFKTQHNIDPYIVPVGDSNPQKKAQYIENEIYYAEGDVIIFLDEGKLKADKISYDSLNKVFKAYSNITFKKGNQFFKANYLEFDFFNDKGFIDNAFGILEDPKLKAPTA